MHSQFLIGVSLALCVARGVMAAPAPLEITHPPVKTTGGAPDQEETDNLARLKTAETDANRHLKKMEHVLNNPTVPQNAEMIEAAFGKNAQVDKIKGTVQKLQTGKLPVTLHTDPDPSFVAAVNFDTSTHPATSGTTKFGKSFHNTAGSDNMRAATLVHEATHKLANAGDTVDNHNKMIAADDFKTPESGRYGYASHIEPAKTVAELNKDKVWTGLRDGDAVHQPIADLHNNAESYAQFGSMCDAAISNAAVGLRRRALERRDWETAAMYLIRRQACARRKKGAVGPAASKKTKLSSTAKTKLAAVSKLTTKKKGANPVRAASKGQAPKSLKKSRLPTTKSAAAAKSQSPKSAKKKALPTVPKAKTKLVSRPVKKATTQNLKVTKKTPKTAGTSPKVKAKTKLVGRPAKKVTTQKVTKKAPKTTGTSKVKAKTNLASRPAAAKKVTTQKATKKTPKTTGTSPNKTKPSTKLPVKASTKKASPLSLKSKPAPIEQPVRSKVPVKKVRRDFRL